MDDQNTTTEVMTSEQANEVLNTTDTAAPAQPTGKDVAKAIGIYAGLGLATSAGIVVGMRIADRFCDWVGGKVRNRKKKDKESDSDDKPQSEKTVETSPDGEKILADS